MWPIFVEFRSASSDIRGEKKKKESVVKHKCGDNYVGRPNKSDKWSVHFSFDVGEAAIVGYYDVALILWFLPVPHARSLASA